MSDRLCQLNSAESRHVDGGRINLKDDHLIPEQSFPKGDGWGWINDIGWSNLGDLPQAEDQ